MTEITCRRTGRKWEQQWPHRSALGYTIMAERDNGDGTVGAWVAGFAVQSVDNWGRKRGWIILDHETGALLLSIAEATRVGEALADALYMFERHLEEAEACTPRPPVVGYDA